MSTWGPMVDRLYYYCHSYHKSPSSPLRHAPRLRPWAPHSRGALLRSGRVISSGLLSRVLCRYTSNSDTTWGNVILQAWGRGPQEVGGDGLRTQGNGAVDRE